MQSFNAPYLDIVQNMDPSVKEKLGLPDKASSLAQRSGSPTQAAFAKFQLSNKKRPQTAKRAPVTSEEISERNSTFHNYSRLNLKRFA